MITINRALNAGTGNITAKIVLGTINPLPYDTGTRSMSLRLLLLKIYFFEEKKL